MAKIPDQIDKYKVEELIAVGGMGAVYRGLHPTLGRAVILKKLTLRGNATVTERFKREARILMDFRNDNIVDVQDHFVQGRSHYIVMEYVDGQSLKDILDEERYLDNCTAALIALHTARALRYAHSKGVVHRDIKPGNILISKSGDIKLADFGIASSADGDPFDDTLTSDGMTLGTPAYMAPEQFENSRTVDHRADLYSLGVMMYEMLTGLKPFPGSFTPETVRRIQKGKYKSPEKINPSVSPGLRRIIRSLIKPNPRSRCGDTDGVIAKLERWLSAYNEDDVKLKLCAIVREENAPAAARKKSGRMKIIIPAAAAVLLIAATAFLFCTATGFHRRILFPDAFGQLSFRVDTGSHISGTVPHTELFIDDGDKIPAAETAVRYLPRTAADKLYRSLPLALPSGRYRAKTTLGSRIIWTSFELPAWTDAGKSRFISVAAFEDAEAPITFTYAVHDSASGSIISNAAAKVFQEGDFIPAAKADLFSGRVYHFRLSAAGYEPQEYILKINRGDSALHIRAELAPAEEKETEK